VKAQQLTVWRRLARDGKLVVAADKDESASFVAIEVSSPASKKDEAASHRWITEGRDAL